MNKFNFLILVFVLCFNCCKEAKQEVDPLAITKKYYRALDESRISDIAGLLTDSLLTRETEYDYEQVFTLKQYQEWMQWDSVFDPSYEVLWMRDSSGTVKTRISKIDQRIRFLHQGPIVTDHTLYFNGDRISMIETTKYVVFNDSLFVARRDSMVNWIGKNYPELNGFIFDQTRSGGKNYLKAMELYKNRSDL